MSALRELLFVLTLLSLAMLAACADSPTAAQPPAKASVPLAKADVPPIAVFPQRREIDGYTMIIHAPQFRSWPDFERTEAWIAIELTPPGGSETVYGTAVLIAETAIEMPRRGVKLEDKSVERVIFAANGTPELEAFVQHHVREDTLDIPLDLFLAYLADVPGTGLQLMVNANWPVFEQGGNYYLLYQQHWLTTSELAGIWEYAQSLPAGFEKLPAEDNFAAPRAALPLKAGTGASYKRCR